MKRSKPLGTSALFDVEQIQFAGGKTLSLPSSELEIYSSHLIDWDAKRSEAYLLRDQSTHPLVRLRALIFRGRFKEAQSMLASLRSLSKDPEEITEIVIEEARLHSLQGEWNQCASLCQMLENEKMTLPSRLVVFELLGHSYFELGEWKLAKLNLEKAETLSTVFPNCPAATYTQILLARTLGRTQGPTQGFLLINELWSALKSEGRLDRNNIHALLRAEIDLDRLQGRDHFSKAYASWLLAEAMGEKLFSALGTLDSYYASRDQKARDFFKPKVKEACEEYERVRRMNDEIQSGTSSLFSSTQAIQCYLRGLREPEAKDSLRFSQRIDSVVFAHAAFGIHLESGEISSFEAHPQIIRGIHALAHGKVLSKRDFFHLVWGKRAYVSRLHDSVIRNLLFRMNQIIRARFSIENGFVSTRGLLILK